MEADRNPAEAGQGRLFLFGGKRWTAVRYVESIRCAPVMARAHLISP